jgi:neutral amino acid transport system permease protein
VTEFLQLLVNGLVVGSLTAVTAAGLTLLYGILRFANFAYGDYLTLGAFLAYTLNVTWRAPLGAAVPGAIALSALFGLAQERALWRPLRRRRIGATSLFVTSFGVGLILRSVVLLVWGPDGRSLRLDPFASYGAGGIRLSRAALLSVVLASCVIALLGLFLALTPVGKALRAIADNGELAAVAGIDVERMVLYTWIIGAGLAGLGGVLAALVENSLDPNLGYSLLLPIFAAVILGGIGSAYGALAGGVLVGVVSELSTWRAFAGGLSPAYKPVVAFVVLLAALMFRPYGLLGNARLR